jgi:PhoH-like ATPase
VSEIYTGIKEINVCSELIDSLFATGAVELPDKRYTLYPNMFVVLTCGNQSAITRVKMSCGNPVLTTVKNKLSASGIHPKNREQVMALDLLLDPAVPVVVLTGIAGSGKTLLSMAAAMTALQKESYQRLVLTRPMSQVGRRDLGLLPGDVNEKFGPYLQNYINNIEQITGKDDLASMSSKYPIDLIPLQLIRGASWARSFVIADEIQVLDSHEMATLGTRIGEGSKLVLMGDLKQRDERIAEEATGLYKFANNIASKESPLVGVVELVKCERSEVAALFAKVFDV